MRERQRRRKKKIGISAVDLFCGAGGLTRGLEKAGIDVKLGVDLDPACAFPYEFNNQAKFLLKPIEKLKSSEVKKALGKSTITLLAGCAPCQPFSSYRVDKKDKSDSRWDLLDHFRRLILRVQPTIITMENVPGLADQAIFKKFVKSLQRKKYNVSYKVVKCAEYGVPQRRERLVLLASLLGPISLIPPTHTKKKQLTVKKVIGTLPRLTAGQIHTKDPLHQSSGLSDINLQRIKASRPGGTWREWKSALVAKCHKRKTGKTYPGVYGRMCWDQPAPTITTQFFGFGNGRFGHPVQNRAISLREGAILQSFPKNYQFTKPGEIIRRDKVGMLIGNAVPVGLAYAIGKTFQKHIEEFK